jgi:hypothetical protein
MPKSFSMAHLVQKRYMLFRCYIYRVYNVTFPAFDLYTPTRYVNPKPVTARGLSIGSHEYDIIYSI